MIEEINTLIAQAIEIMNKEKATGITSWITMGDGKKYRYSIDELKQQISSLSKPAMVDGRGASRKPKSTFCDVSNSTRKGKSEEKAK